MFAALTAALALFTQPQSVQPSFDCSRASSVVEHTICSDAELARLDRRMADRFRALRSELDPATRAALLEDQRTYLWARDETTATVPESERPAFLAEAMRGRIGFFDALVTRPPAGLTGYWTNGTGEVFISPLGDGKVRIRATASEPASGRWTCDFDVTARLTGSDAAEGVPADSPDVEIGGDWAIRLERKGAQLTLEECCGAGHCGLNGTISGSYFFRAAVPPARWREY